MTTLIVGILFILFAIFEISALWLKIVSIIAGTILIVEGLIKLLLFISEIMNFGDE